MYNAKQLEALLRKYGPVKRGHGSYGLQLIAKCPICAKQKLSVNAKSGLYRCWHGCMSGHVDNLFSSVRLAKQTEFASAVKKLAPRRGVDIPGELVPLSHLSDGHQALSYLTSRKFDPDELDAYYGFRYCPSGRKYAGGLFDTTNTLVIPIYHQNELIGWQARLLYNPDSLTDDVCSILEFPQDSDGDYIKPPKYFTMPGIDKGKLLWNYDWARQSEVVVVCEGVFDAARVGRCAVATLGKNLSDDQIGMLRAYWKLVIVLLDPDAQREIEALECKLGNSVGVVLQGYKDAGDAPQLEVWKQIDRTLSENDGLRRAGLDLSSFKFIV